jgi:uncharacterized protein with HEPN domain
MRREAGFLQDALKALSELQTFTAGTNEERFLSNPLEQSYLFHRLVIFGEAMARLAPAFQEKYPHLPWGPVIALRNRLVHSYFDLDMVLLWQIGTTRIEEMQRELNAILSAEFPPEAAG